MQQKGKLIIIYGINNIGKSTQAKLLVKKLRKAGQKCEYIKYPVYDLAPSGQIINGYLRAGNPYQLSAREAQIFYTLNRAQFEPVLAEKLKKGINIVAEDYIGSGIAWGISAGIEQTFLEKINFYLIREDVSILLDGNRFLKAREKNHIHEKDDDFISKTREVYLQLAKKYGWIVIAANRNKEEVSGDIFSEINRKNKDQLDP